MSYANGDLSQWDQFTAQVEPIALVKPYMVARYLTNYVMFHFCIADSEHDWREGSDQYKWIEKYLASVDKNKQPWQIFAAHRVLRYSSNSWYAQEGSFEDPWEENIYRSYGRNIKWISRSMDMFIISRTTL
ncbi:inactive purple acid phosphatase-like protein [Artemisia annua]|uniref:Inactive purple acid phosphatase-like protein n=1 Tax=Artemisia annua TaxID=35608 RepID=A0A2U1LBK2_ARTAN|nr:inactive purple acid phosphatase-like protein [Artemisia annua]